MISKTHSNTFILSIGKILDSFKRSFKYIAGLIINFNKQSKCRTSLLGLGLVAPKVQTTSLGPSAKFASASYEMSAGTAFDHTSCLSSAEMPRKLANLGHTPLPFEIKPTVNKSKASSNESKAPQPKELDCVFPKPDLNKTANEIIGCRLPCNKVTSVRNFAIFGYGPIDAYMIKGYRLFATSSQTGNDADGKKKLEEEKQKQAKPQQDANPDIKTRSNEIIQQQNGLLAKTISDIKDATDLSNTNPQKTADVNKRKDNKENSQKKSPNGFDFKEFIKIALSGFFGCIVGLAGQTVFQKYKSEGKFEKNALVKLLSKGMKFSEYYDLPKFLEPKKLNKELKETLKRMTSADSVQNAITIAGHGGTGKTTFIKEIMTKICNNDPKLRLFYASLRADGDAWDTLTVFR